MREVIVLEEKEGNFNVSLSFNKDASLKANLECAYTALGRLRQQVEDLLLETPDIPRT